MVSVCMCACIPVVHTMSTTHTYPYACKNLSARTYVCLPSTCVPARACVLSQQVCFPTRVPASTQVPICVARADTLWDVPAAPHLPLCGGRPGGPALPDHFSTRPFGFLGSFYLHGDHFGHRPLHSRVLAAQKRCLLREIHGLHERHAALQS